MKGRCVAVLVFIYRRRRQQPINLENTLQESIANDEKERETTKKSIRIILCVSQNDQQHYNKFMKSPTIEPHVNVCNCFTYSNNTLSKWFYCCLICIKFSENTQFSTWGRTKNDFFFYPEIDGNFIGFDKKCFSYGE